MSLERSKSFLHPPQPVARQQSMSPLARRSHSIADVLRAVERGHGSLVSPDAYLPVAGGGPHSVDYDGHTPPPPPRSQQEMFRSSSFVANTSSYDAVAADLARRRALDRNVVLFPKELRGENRFFTDPEYGQKAAALVQDSRRPSSLFSEGVSSSCREELNTIHRVKRYEDIKLRAMSPSGAAARPSSRLQASSSSSSHHHPPRAASVTPFRPVEWDSREIFGTTASGGGGGYGGGGGGGGGTTAPLFLVHLSEEEREMVEEREKLGRRVEYGRMVGMFREEILASRVNRHRKAVKHMEVERHDAKRDEPVIDWAYCEISDATQLMDVMPRGGIVVTSDGQRKRIATEAELAKERAAEKRALLLDAGGGVVEATGGDTQLPLSNNGPKPQTPGALATKTPAIGNSGQPKRPPLASSSQARAQPSCPPGVVVMATRENSSGNIKGKTKLSSTPILQQQQKQKPPAKKSGGRGTAKVGEQPQQQQQQQQQQTATATTSATNYIPPWEDQKKSVIWRLKYCFNDDDAESIIDIQRGLVVVESGGQKYAFDPSKKPKSRDLEQEEHATDMSSATAAKRERLLLLKMSPEDREARRVRLLLDSGKAFEGRHVRLANNYLTRMDLMLTNTLATTVRTNITKLDLSFNRIDVIDESFLVTRSTAESEERKKHTLHDAEVQEEEALRFAALASGGLTSESQKEKERETFLNLRRRALRDLVDHDAAHKLFYHLQSLYLHGNPLRDISEIWKLEPLRHTLQYLTFHGGQHHVDAQAKDPRHRAKLLAIFPRLVQLNFTTLLPGDEEEPVGPPHSKLFH